MIAAHSALPTPFLAAEFWKSFAGLKTDVLTYNHATGKIFYNDTKGVARSISPQWPLKYIECFDQYDTCGAIHTRGM
jgi:hypothetical protein